MEQILENVTVDMVIYSAGLYIIQDPTYIQTLNETVFQSFWNNNIEYVTFTIDQNGYLASMIGLEEIDEENDYVTKGQPICRIGNEDIPIQLAQIDVNIAKANAVVTRYKNSYERYKKLRDFGAVSLEQYEEIETNYKAALEEVKQLQLQREQYEIQQKRLVVNAPLNGEVLMLYKNAGSFLSAGASVALIGDFSNLEFTDVVNDDELNRLGDLSLPGELVINKRDLDKIYNNSYNQGNKGIMQKFNVKITAVEPPLEVEADMRTVHWSVDNSSGLLEPRRYQDATI